MSQAEQIQLDQEDFWWRLLADPAIAEVPVLLQRKGVTESDVETALAGLQPRYEGARAGVAIIVLMPSLTPETPDVPGPMYQVQLTAQVLELPLVAQGDGGIGLTAEAIAQVVRRSGHQWANGEGGLYVFDGMEPIPVDGKISYGVRFTRQAGDAVPARVSQPSIHGVGGSPGEYELTCITPGAEIYYTTDGSYPASSNGAATLYTAPFAIADGTTVRAAAEAAGLIPSDVTRHTHNS
jgi:hypothetical protein